MILTTPDPPCCPVQPKALSMASTDLDVTFTSRFHCDHGGGINGQSENSADFACRA
jgi:hypothetical protein